MFGRLDFKGWFIFVCLSAPLVSGGVVCRLGGVSAGRDDGGEAIEVVPVFYQVAEIVSLIMLLRLGSEVFLASWRCSRPQCLRPFLSLLIR